MAFTFGRLDGLTAVDEPHLADLPRYDETMTAWSSTEGITDTYLIVRNTAATGTIGSPEGDITMTPIAAVPSGEAWLAIDNGVSEPLPSSSTRIMWWRDDGRLWIASTYGLAPERLTSLVLAIEAGDDGALNLADPSMVRLGTTSLSTYKSLRQQWSLDGHGLELAVTNGGLVLQLGDLPVRSIVEHPIADRAGYKITLSNGQVNLTWPTDDPEWWASVITGPTLADRIDAVAAAVTST